LLSPTTSNQRIVGGTVDIGAYEYQTPVSQISYAWLQQYDLPITTHTDTGDPAGDGLKAYQEWIAGTNPTNALSVLVMLPPRADEQSVGSCSGLAKREPSNLLFAEQP
jgi:hypothetical protein